MNHFSAVVIAQFILLSSGNLGGWSQVGGTLINETATTATCAFNHNTDYTLLQVWPAMCQDTQYWDEWCMTRGHLFKFTFECCSIAF